MELNKEFTDILEYSYNQDIFLSYGLYSCEEYTSQTVSNHQALISLQAPPPWPLHPHYKQKKSQKAKRAAEPFKDFSRVPWWFLMHG